LALTQYLAGDAAGAKVTAEQARDTFESLFKDQPDNALFVASLSQAYAAMGQKDLALREAERAIMFRSKDRAAAPSFEENLALIQTIFGENNRAISILNQLLHTPYRISLYSITPVTAALLRLDPIWDPLRGDPAFQKLCEKKLDKKIPVLPFENLSGDPKNAYFATGIHEENLTRPSKIADLKVISRSSTSRYKSKPDDIAEIAKQLGVANILEGSVQKLANEAHINVQLINALTGAHIWAQSYDRALEHLFTV